MGQELMDLGTAIEALTMAGGITGLIFNCAAYSATLDVARRRENWTPDEWQGKCDQYWRESLVNEDLKGIKKTIRKVYMNIMFRPGTYLACKYLSKKGE